MANAIRIERAASAEADRIADLYLASRADALPFLPRLHTDDETRAWVRDRLMPRCRVWVAWRDAAIVGFLALDGAEVDQLYVRPGHHRTGVGSALLDVAKQEGPGALRLFTFQRNARARAFYEAQGFHAMAWTDGAGNEEREPDVLFEWAGA